MPESHKAENARRKKQNIAAGIGDESGRIVRVKAEAKMGRCIECQAELKITKTNTELKLHSENKHGKTIDICFPGAEAISAEMKNAVAGGKKGNDAKASSGKGGKKASKENLDDLLMAGMAGGPGAKKKKGKK
ncbi:hypothetical protein QTG54_001274 [Skeletonema marinoi]|uniref:Uncharacterized protein n=1 Tax=Skeletonema marinoi TaxID=267567 RepID=A0AAD9DGV8_9STRA|nr:hypothetical protein QTG54_011939 [Skeletonema marinoi]KAK1747310.1 hypothetical protein QTG54_001273 [Skeletonema marinoi]KAK1747311.1 hypothetical protein QTG54_001274 [Skeletonema marinoi]|mmetsp:Transcript_10274/g.20617  ORF Transcript_10274/g.20617 Transcript_10274/m.20617 type:complete len:133 (-) Transcript_10274:441-839(-)|eukprot:CAMPEP_0113396236 /NCGR_PEP_ID=MMETSP0013_2-20120614/13677_1 /TAXON_ID=2843 ORGANISM="Skeletonema costatum, Strain 1716" /NCGR_SAMPLE_ID=MMETSP0013_2 /ASSEMBLY_ACC=CAM_ASM_000158 /LENGTH=132 /DNA_ID=CAMNT_0000280615 /DNA_START=123 /DNA_END=521 /DNA_ORIENTATION=+ /assembly_acc=CAM_ASM_000158